MFTVNVFVSFSLILSNFHISEEESVVRMRGKFGTGSAGSSMDRDSLEDFRFVVFIKLSYPPPQSFHRKQRRRTPKHI